MIQNPTIFIELPNVYNFTTIFIELPNVYNFTDDYSADEEDDINCLSRNLRRAPAFITSTCAEESSSPFGTVPIIASLRSYCRSASEQPKRRKTTKIREYPWEKGKEQKLSNTFF